MNPLPFPAAEFLADSGVRVTLARRDFASVVALVVMAAASWTQQHERGSFPDDPERIAASTGLPTEVVVAALDTWVAEGWVKREGGKVWLPWVTKAAAEDDATAAARSEQAQKAAVVRWAGKDGELQLVSPSHAGRNAVSIVVEADGWPKTFAAVACDVWVQRCGPGSAPGQEIAGHFRQLRKQGAPWDEVLESWTAYVRYTEVRYLSAGAWRKRWRTFLDATPEAPDPDTVSVVRSVKRQLERGDFDDDDPGGQGGRSTTRRLLS